MRLSSTEENEHWFVTIRERSFLCITWIFLCMRTWCQHPCASVFWYLKNISYIQNNFWFSWKKNLSIIDFYMWEHVHNLNNQLLQMPQNNLLKKCFTILPQIQFIIIKIILSYSKWILFGLTILDIFKNFYLF